MVEEVAQPSSGVQEVAQQPSRNPLAPRRLVLLRHGRTAWNLADRAQGHADISMDEVGHAQARGAAPAVAALQPVRIVSSDLARARQTAEYVAQSAGLPVVPDRRLREVDIGERSGLTRAEFSQRFPDAYAAWLADDDTHPAPGEESRAEVAARMAPALAEHLAALGPGELGVLVLHGACAKVALAVLLDWPLRAVPTLRGLDNCRWAVVEERERDGLRRLVGYNLSAPPAVERARFASDGAVG